MSQASLSLQAPKYESTVDTVQDVIDRNIDVFTLPGNRISEEPNNK